MKKKINNNIEMLSTSLGFYFQLETQKFYVKKTQRIGTFFLF